MYISIRNTIKNYLLKRHIKKFGSKNNGYFNFFVINWSEYKDFVLWLVNHKNYFVRMFGRYKFRINQDREAKGKLIKDIFPNHYDIENPDGSITSVFRTHQKYAKRLYYGFYPVWWVLHFLDWLIQKTVAPEFSFGFDTLTAYPDADPETSSVDGTAGREGVSESYSTIRSGEGNSANSSLNVMSVILSTTGTTNEWDSNRRALMSFVTSGIDDEATITDAKISLRFAKYSEEAGDSPSAVILQTYFSSNTVIQSGDYEQFGTTSLGSIAWAAMVNGDYSEIDISESVVSKTEATRLGVKSNWDFGNSPPSWRDGAVSYYAMTSAEGSGTSYDPKLVVTYTLPSTFVPQINMI